MSSKKRLVVLILAFAVVLTGAVVMYNALKDKLSYSNLTETKPDTETQESGNTEEETLTLAPDFTVIDSEGNEVKLSDMRGKPVIVNFWASWCGPCKSEMPEFDEAYEKYKDDICFMMVNLTDNSSETVASAKSYIESQGYSFPVYYDTMLEAATAYSVYSIPATYFIDAEGNAIAYAVGAIDSATLQKGIDMIYTED